MTRILQQINIQYKIGLVASIAAIAVMIAIASPMAAVSADTNPASPSGKSPTVSQSQLAAGCVAGSNTFWANEAAFGGSLLVKVDSCGHVLHSFSPASAPYSNGRGVTVNDDGNIIYTALNGTGCLFCGDGPIHTMDQIGGSDKSTIPDPGGRGGPGIGAIDFQKGALYAVSYMPDSSGNQTVYKLKPSTGAVLASCKIPGVDGGNDDTLAVRGTDFYTDNGEFGSLTLNQYHLPTVPGGGACTFVTSYTLPDGVTGIDFGTTGNLSTHLFAVTASSGLDSICDLGVAPFSSIVSCESLPAGHSFEDIASYAPLQ